MHCGGQICSETYTNNLNFMYNSVSGHMFGCSKFI